MADSVQWLSQSDYSICISILVELVCVLTETLIVIQTKGIIIHFVSIVYFYIHFKIIFNPVLAVSGMR